MTACILWGGFGWGNVGDELNLAVALKDMKKEYQDDIAIISPNYSYSKWLFPDEEILPFEQLSCGRNHQILKSVFRRIKPLSDRIETALENKLLQSYFSSDLNWVRSIKNAQHLHLVGGGYFTDIFNLWKVLLPIRIAKEHGVTISTSPLGIGPFYKKKNENEFFSVFEDVNIKVRDRESLALCEKHQLNAKLEKDDGFRVEELLDRHCQSSQSMKKPIIGICVFYQHGAEASQDKYFIWWSQLLRCLDNKGFGDQIEGFCFHKHLEADFSYLVQLFDKAGMDARSIRAPVYNFYDEIYNVRKYSLVLTTRFHSAVVASVFNIPLFMFSSGRYYYTKMRSVAQDSPQSSLINIDQTGPDLTADRIEEMFRGIVPRNNM